MCCDKKNMDTVFSYFLLSHFVRIYMLGIHGTLAGKNNKIVETKCNKIPQVTAVIASFTVFFKLEHVVVSRSTILFLIVKSDSKFRSLQVQMIGLFFSFLKKRRRECKVMIKRKFTFVVMLNLKRKLEKVYAQN